MVHAISFPGFIFTKIANLVSAAWDKIMQNLSHFSISSGDKKVEDLMNDLVSV